MNEDRYIPPDSTEWKMRERARLLEEIEFYQGFVADLTILKVPAEFEQQRQDVVDGAVGIIESHRAALKLLREGKDYGKTYE